ncbi:MAG: glycosyltransferase 87 family protein [Agriterribacter sp.]
MKLTLGIILCAIAILCLWKAFDRDAHLIKMGTQDLRNRIVGARMQKDGKVPYFYKWNPGDGLRYYDPANFDTLSVANITATPFYHMLLYPIADFQHSAIKKIWLCLQYVLLILMVALCVRLTNVLVNKLLIISTAIAFLFTEAWINLIVSGQLYLAIPFLFLLFFYCFRKVDKSFFAFITGLIFIVLVLIRLNSIVAFCPFILLIKHYSGKQRILFFLPVVVILSCIFFSSSQRNLWISYGKSVEEQVKYHSSQHVLSQANATDPMFKEWEGMNMDDIKREEEIYGYKNYSENGNFFVLVDNIFHKRLSPAFLFRSSFVLILIALTIFAWYTRKWDAIPIIHISIFGYCLYMISDLFSPVHRHQYYTVQWLMPLLVSGIIFSSKKWLLYTLIFAGLVLNIINVPAILMEHTMGEYIWLAAFMLLSFTFSAIDTGNKKWSAN